MIKIEVTKRTDEICIKALKAALTLYNGDVSGIVAILKDGFTEPANFYEEGISKFNEYLKMLKPSGNPNLEKVIVKIGNSLNGEKDLSFDEMCRICNALELVDRLWLGQWNELAKVLTDKWILGDDELTKVNLLRDEMTDAYSRKRISGYASYGIYSTELKDEIRLIYAFQKVYRYEKAAIGVDSTPFKLYDDLSSETPKITLPYKESVTFKTQNEIKEYAEKYMASQNVDLHFYTEIRKIYFEDTGIYFPTNPQISYLVEPGDTVHLKQNDFFIVEKTPENLNKNRSN